MEYAPTCPACKIIYEDKNASPPCETCRVELFKENEEIAEIFFMCRGQVVTLGENIVDINHSVLWENIDRFKVNNPKWCFMMVCKVFHHFLKKEREGQKK
jgi:hypothetical protein